MNTTKENKLDPNNNMQDNTSKSTSLIGLYDASELLVLPSDIVKALTHGGLIGVEVDTTPLMLSLDDVITVATVIRHYRECHREVINAHEIHVWEKLNEFEQLDA